MRHFHSLAVTLAMAIAVLLQAPGESMNSQGIQGGQGIEDQTPCQYSGYAPIPCTFASSNCTAGSFDAPLMELPTGNFRKLSTQSVRGNCTGNSFCETPATSDLTSSGC